MCLSFDSSSSTDVFLTTLDYLSSDGRVDMAIESDEYYYKDAYYEYEPAHRKKSNYTLTASQLGKSRLKKLNSYRAGRIKGLSLIHI